MKLELFGPEVADDIVEAAVKRCVDKAARQKVRPLSEQEKACIRLGAYAAILETQDYLTRNGVLSEVTP